MALFTIFIRGVIWALGFSLTLGVVQAASGGLFGDILAKILGITNEQVLTYTGDGTVHNAAKLGGLQASEFQKIAPNQSCGAGKCMFGIDNDGNVMCR